MAAVGPDPEDRVRAGAGLSDPRLADFVALNQPEVRRRVERTGEYFVVEGVVAIERLLGLPQWKIRTLALLPNVAERLGSRLDHLDSAVVVVDQEVLRQVVGFDLHRGALASVTRQPPTDATSLVRAAGSGVLLAAEAVNDHENLGALYRNAAAFGVSGVLLDPSCADPFYRRSVRVSAGQVLAVPTGALGPLPQAIREIQALGATVLALTPHAAEDLRDPTVRASLGARVGPLVLLVGAEGPGLSTDALDAADRRVAIPMAPGVDSLNVATAAAVALAWLT